MHYSFVDESSLIDREMNPTDIEKNDDKLNLEGTRFLNDDRSCVQRLSNQTVLAITCALFAAFVIAEIIGALVRDSIIPLQLRSNCIFILFIGG